MLTFLDHSLDLRLRDSLGEMGVAVMEKEKELVEPEGEMGGEKELVVERLEGEEKELAVERLEGGEEEEGYIVSSSYIERVGHRIRSSEDLLSPLSSGEGSVGR